MSLKFDLSRPALLVDATTDVCVAAVVGEGRLLGRCSKPMRRGHAEHLAAFAREALADAGIDAAALSAVISTTGPGGFVGSRIGPAFARALALSLSVPAIGIGTLEAIGAGAEGRRMVVADAGRGVLAAQCFEPDGPLLLLPVEELADRLPGEPFTLLGPAGGALLGQLDAARQAHVSLGRRDIEPVAAVHRALRRHGAGEAMQPVPVYARPPDAAPPPPPLYQP